jgi:hypothetical protein
MTGPTPPPLPADLEALLRHMHLPYMRRAGPEVLATARAQRWDPAEVLKVLLPRRWLDANVRHSLRVAP